MSGGWVYTFSLSSVGDVDLTFDWELLIDSDYEANEFGQMLVSLDGDERVIQTLTGDGNGGSDQIVTGTATKQIWPNVGAGSHTISLGGYNNLKTFNNEFTRVQMDNVVITVIGGTVSPSSPSPVVAPTPAPTAPPVVPPTPPPTVPPTPEVSTTCPNGPTTYFPGGKCCPRRMDHAKQCKTFLPNLISKSSLPIVDLTVTLGGGLATSTLLASTGLNGRVLTREGQSVQFDAGGQSSASMHGNADGAAIVPDDSNPNRYYLVSNSETSSGGVGILHFDATTTPHSVIGYRRTGQNTNTGSRNCGGGRTPWGTWLTSEESGSGTVNESK